MSKFVKIVTVILLLLFVISSQGFAGSKKKKRRRKKSKTKVTRTVKKKKKTVKASDTSGIRKPIEIEGQSRGFNMMLILKNKKDKISFVKIRTDYKEEIESTEP